MEDQTSKFTTENNASCTAKRMKRKWWELRPTPCRNAKMRRIGLRIQEQIIAQKKKRAVLNGRMGKKKKQQQVEKKRNIAAFFGEGGR